MEPVGEILRQILDRETVKIGEQYHRFFRAWRSLAGEQLGGLSRVLEIDKGHVIVAVDHPAALQLFRLQQGVLLKKIRERFPEMNVRAVRGVVRPPAASGANEQAAARVPAEGSDPQIEGRIARIKDGRLRESLQRLYRASLEQGEGEGGDGGGATRHG